ncbi:MAG: DNA-processing protein DprA [candidate division KSB1 bacterium]|nr:DNA-processing protein DprA [candidate division KSB1 bacterium]
MDVEGLLTLLCVPGLGPRRILALVGKLGSPAAVLKASLAELCRVDGIDRTLAERTKTEANPLFAQEQIRRAQQLGVQFVTYWDPEYPKALKQIPDPPPLLYCKGTLKSEKETFLAVVGTRTPTAYGRVMTEKLCRELAERGLTIVSGLARGVDTIAHRAALQAGGRTVAVLGSGLDVIYPGENTDLARKIAAQGALLTEFPLGAQPDAPNFPRRNRIIAGMCVGTLVVEAGDKSGALITARYALEQGREVFAVPGNVTSEKSRGTNRLIKEGAKLVESADDILDEIRPQLPSLLREARREPAPPLVGLEKRVFEALSQEPKHIDDLAAELGEEPGRVLAALLSLELKSLATQLTGKYFVRA